MLESSLCKTQGYVLTAVTQGRDDMPLNLVIEGWREGIETKYKGGTSLVVQWLDFSFQCRAASSIPGWELGPTCLIAKIPRQKTEAVLWQLQ